MAVALRKARSEALRLCSDVCHWLDVYQPRRVPVPIGCVPKTVGLSAVEARMAPTLAASMEPCLTPMNCQAFQMSV